MCHLQALCRAQYSVQTKDFLSPVFVKIEAKFQDFWDPPRGPQQTRLHPGPQLAAQVPGGVPDLTQERGPPWQQPRIHPVPSDGRQDGEWGGGQQTELPGGGGPGQEGQHHLHQ